MSVLEDVRNLALQLPPSDRASLARELLLSLEGDGFDSDADAAWTDEIRARAEAVASGDFTASDWRESVDRIRGELIRKRAL